MYKILIERTNSYYPRPFNSKEEAAAFIKEKENLVLTRIGKYNANLKEIITNIARYFADKEKLSDVCSNTILFDTEYGYNTTVPFFHAIEIVYLSTIVFETKLLINDKEFIIGTNNNNIQHFIIKYLLETKKDIQSISIDTNGEGYVDYKVTHLDYPFTLVQARDVVFPDDNTSDITMWEFVSNQREDVGDTLINAAEKKILEGINELIELKDKIQNLYYFSTQKR
jgi:hypothetical protein